MPDPQDFADILRITMAKLKPTMPRHQYNTRANFVPRALDTCTHVFLRTDSVKTPLQSPYEGPFKVLNRTPKHFEILKGDKTDNVSIDRLKPAYVDGGSLVSNIKTNHNNFRVRPFSKVQFAV